MDSPTNRWMEPSAAPEKRDYVCWDCPEAFQTPAARYNHRRKDHRGEQRRDRAMGNPPTDAPIEAQGEGPSEGLEVATPSVPTEMDGVRMDSVHELTRRFADALDGAAPDMATIKKRRIIQSFDNYADAINTDPSKLERFLTISGLMVSQAQFIKLVLFGVDDPNPPSPYTVPGQGGPQAMTWDPYTGQWVPVTFIFQDNQGQLWEVSQPYYYP